MTSPLGGDVKSVVRNKMAERCVPCADWVYPTWTVTWVDGQHEIRCGLHGGADREPRAGAS